MMTGKSTGSGRRGAQGRSGEGESLKKRYRAILVEKLTQEIPGIEALIRSLKPGDLKG